MTDLLDLITTHKRYDIEDACARRKAARLARSKAARRGWETQRAKFRAIDAFRQPDIPADDWAPCQRCGFVLVACDCDADHGHFNRAREMLNATR